MNIASSLQQKLQVGGLFFGVPKIYDVRESESVLNRVRLHDCRRLIWFALNRVLT